MRTPSGSVDCAEVIDTAPVGRYQVQVFALAGFVGFLDGFDLQAIAFAAPQIAAFLGIKASALGPIFASALVGMALGSVFVGMLADRWGRKKALVLSTVMFGGFAALTAFAKDYQQLLVLRFLTGIGLGGALPTIVALTSEYAPKRIRARLITLIGSGLPLGALVGGLASTVMLERWGWQSVCLLGGVIPLVLAVVLARHLPESLQFMVTSGAPAERIRQVLSRVVPGTDFNAVQRFALPETKDAGFLLGKLFAAGRAAPTLLMWIPSFMNFLVSFFMSSWLPTVMRQAGLPQTQAIMVLVLFNLGGAIGCIVQGRLIDRRGPYLVLGCAFAACAACVAALGQVGPALAPALALTMVAGFCIQGASGGLAALAATYYPTEVRSTGVGTLIAVGRIGAIVGPLIGGLLLSAEQPLSFIFSVGAVPPLVALASMGALAVLMRSRQSRGATPAGLQHP